MHETRKSSFRYFLNFLTFLVIDHLYINSDQLRGECYFTAEGCFYSHIPCSIAKYEELAKDTKNFRELRTRLEQAGYVWNRRVGPQPTEGEDHENADQSMLESKTKSGTLQMMDPPQKLMTPFPGQKLAQYRGAPGFGKLPEGDSWQANSSLFSSQKIFHTDHNVFNAHSSSLWSGNTAPGGPATSAPNIGEWSIGKADIPSNMAKKPSFIMKSSSMDDWKRQNVSLSGAGSVKSNSMGSSGSGGSSSEGKAEEAEVEVGSGSPKDSKLSMSELRDDLPELPTESPSSEGDGECGCANVVNEGKKMAEWDCDDVYDFVKSIGDHKCWEQYATKLRDEEVDGLTLKVYVNFNDIVEDYPGIKKGHARVLANCIRRRLR